MKCINKGQAEAVAAAGAKKMGAYTVLSSTFKGFYNRHFRVYKTGETVATYHVGIEAGKEFCGCKFFQENKQFGTCKHICYCREVAADNARADELAEMEAARIDFAFDGDCDTEECSSTDWPSCPFHGAYAPMMAFPHLPETDCERCIKNALR